MPDPVTLNFNDLMRMADAAPDKSIIVKDGGFRSVGKVGAFFASKTSCRVAAQAFLEGIEKQYGDAVAFTLAPELRALQSSGKPLSAHKAQDLLRQARELSQGLAQVNADMAQKFVDGTGITDDPRTLDAAFADYCAARGLNPLDHADLKRAAAAAVTDLAKNSTRLMSFAELGDAVRSMDTMPEVRNGVEIHKFLQGDGKAGSLRGIAEDLKLKDEQMAMFDGVIAGLSPEQKAELDKVIEACLRRAVSQPGAPVTQEALANAVRKDLSVACYLYTCGAPSLRSAVLRDSMNLAANTPHLKDVLSLVSQFGDSYMPVYLLAMQNMDRMRALQPEGTPTRETIWQAYFNEPLPGGFSELKPTGFSSKIFDRLDRIFLAAADGDRGKAAAGTTVLAQGIRMEKALASMKGPVSLGLDDFIAPPFLTALQRLPSLEDAEKQLAVDLNRRGTHQRIAGYEPVITFGRAGQAADTVRIRDLSGADEQGRKDFDAGKPSPVSHGLVDRARVLCGGNEAQLRQVVLSMSQAATILLRVTSAAAGVECDEHSPVDIDVRRMDDGSVSMRYHTPANSPLDADYSYIIAPDGRATMTSFRMQARPAAV